MSPRHSKPTRPSTPTTTTVPSETPRERILADFAALQVPLRPEEFDAALAQADRERLSHLEFLQRLISGPAAWQRERSIAWRVKEARFKEPQTFATFDWLFNAKTIDRAQIEQLASGEFIRRHNNLVVVGQSGVGKSHILQALGQKACVQGWRVRYTTSAALLEDLRGSLADRTLASRLRYYAKFDLLIIDEFFFDRLERMESPEALHLLYKVIDARCQKRSTALVTNIDFDHWGEYLSDPVLAMALSDRIFDNAIVMKIAGKSYRAERARALNQPS